MMLGLLFVVLCIGQASAFNVATFAKQAALTRLAPLAMEPMSHSATFNLMKNAVAERDDSFTIAELTQIQDLIATALERKAAASSASNSLSELCQITKEACDAVTPMLVAIYTKISTPQNEEKGPKGTAYFEERTAKLKADATFFSIADGIVQHMFIDFLFAGDKFGAIVGEEDDTKVNLVTRPYTVDDLVVPDEFNSLIESTLEKVKILAKRIDSEAYKQLTVFCDPIDGTREFATGKGDAVSILIGYNDQFGKPVAGIMYRPLTLPVTWAAGTHMYRRR
jgi:fructose-1,6-bisphosphatase/inositol monophosphatase family enzyme